MQPGVACSLKRRLNMAALPRLSLPRRGTGLRWSDPPDTSHFPFRVSVENPFFHWTLMLAEEQNLPGLAALNRALIGKAEAVDSSWRTILDMDSTECPVYSQGFCPGTNHTTLQCPHVGHPTCFSTRPRRLKTRKTRGGHRIRLCANNFSCTDGLLPVFQPFERRFLLSNIAKPLLSRIVASPGLMGGRSLSLPAYPGVILARWGQERAGEGPLLQGRLP